MCCHEASHSAMVVHSTSHSDLTFRGRPTLGPHKSLPDVIVRLGVRRTQFARQARTRRRCNVFSTSATNKDVRILSYGAKVGRSLNVRGRPAAWVGVIFKLSLSHKLNRHVCQRQHHLNRIWCNPD